jgi:hypothetical protein
VAANRQLSVRKGTVFDASFPYGYNGGCIKSRTLADLCWKEIAANEQNNEKHSRNPEPAVAQDWRIPGGTFFRGLGCGHHNLSRTAAGTGLTNWNPEESHVSKTPQEVSQSRAATHTRVKTFLVHRHIACDSRHWGCLHHMVATRGDTAPHPTRICPISG